ncbi:MAG: glycosyltransferase family 4 protein, partial [Gaiellaceae bacterium]
GQGLGGVDHMGCRDRHASWHMRIGYFSPMPPERTGIADYTALLLPHLRERIDVAVQKRGRRRTRRDVDLNVYHIGNNPDSHSWIVEALRRAPGLVVLHDFVLHHLVAGMTLGRGDGRAYIDAMHRESGVSGRLIAHGVVDGVVASPWEVCPERFPLVGELFPFARGFIVHSRYVEERLRDVGYLGPIWRVAMPAWPLPAPGETQASSAREASDFVVLSFGNLNPSKRLPQLLRAFAELRTTIPRARLVLAGPEASELSLGKRIAEYGLEDVVTRLGWVDEATLWSLIAEAHVCVALRHPTMGETSSVALRAISAGLPMVVSDQGWYSELPDAVAAKVGVDAFEHATLVATLALLARRPDVREAMSCAGRSLVAREHDVERVADAYVAAIEEMAGSELVQVEVAREVARAAGEVGLDPADPDVATLGRHLRELGL